MKRHPNRMHKLIEMLQHLNELVVVFISIAQFILYALEIFVVIQTLLK